MTSVLGIDAAWTTGNPSGVALIRYIQKQGWECVALAPSYEAFIGLSKGHPVDWDMTPTGGTPDAVSLLNAAETLLSDENVKVVSVDMPLSYAPITGRREADRAVSRKFAKYWCATHSPSAARPGEISSNLRDSLAGLGYPLSVSQPEMGTVIEVYPHPALLRLLKRDYRVPYKVARSLRYWPGLSVQERAEKLVAEFQAIYAGLSEVLAGIPVDLLPPPPYKSLNYLKRYEDALDALVCAWSGASYLDGRADHFGDAHAAIWVPRPDN